MAHHRLAALPLVLAASLAGACDEPPTIERVHVSRGVLRPGQQAVVSVTVSNKAGLDEVAGVQLYTPDLAYWYGSLGEVSNGVFETVIDWGRLNAQEPIYFDFPIQRSLLLIAENNDGGSSRHTITFELQCPAGDRACDGVCVPVDINCSDL